MIFLLFEIFEILLFFKIEISLINTSPISEFNKSSKLVNFLILSAKKNKGVHYYFYILITHYLKI